MINFATVEFIGLLNNLAEKAENGIKPFKEATRKDFSNHIFYDEGAMIDDGKYKIVLDACLDDYHHDAVSYLGDGCEYLAFVCVEEDGDLSAQIYFPQCDGIVIIENKDGRWYTE